MADGECLDRGSYSLANSRGRGGSQAAPIDASEDPRDREAPNGEVCMSFCRHCFCFPCIQEWARRRAACPRCQCFVSHIFPLRDGRIHEGHAEGGGRAARRPDGSSRRARARGHGGGSERGRSRRWHRNNRRWRRRGRRANARRRRWLRSMAWDMDHNVGQGLPPEWGILGSSRRRSRQRPGTRRRRRRRRGQARWQRRRDRYEQPRSEALPPPPGAPSPRRRGERWQRRGPSRNRGAARRRSRQGQRSRPRRRIV